MTEDIYSCRCNLIGQTNSMLCYVRDLDSVVKAKLMKCYCFGMYSCVLWDFNNTQVESFCKAWHKGMRRCFDLPYDSHSFILPVLSHALPPFHEMCERFARFITKSMYGSSALVQSVVMHSIHGTGFTSVITTTISTACNHFGWSPRDFIRGKVSVYDDNRLNHLDKAYQITRML